MNDTPTPRTDAVSKSIAQLAGQWVKGEIYPEDFAVGATESLKDIRTLERENQALREALERIATETQGLRLRYRHNGEGESSPPLIEDFARAALKKATVPKT